MGIITLVMDNLNTHVPGSLYETLKPDKAKAILDRFKFVRKEVTAWAKFRNNKMRKLIGNLQMRVRG